MKNKTYFCNVCYNNHEKISRIFSPSYLYEIFGKCCICNNTNLYQMSLTDDEFEVLEKITQDPDYVIALDKLKQQLGNLNDNEFLAIIKVNCDKDFITAMSELKKNDIIDFNLKLSQLKQSTPEPIPTPQQPSQPTESKPKCPTCGSTNIKKISATKRWVGVGMFGLASSDMGKTMQCNNCGYKW